MPDLHFARVLRCLLVGSALAVAGTAWSAGGSKPVLSACAGQSPPFVWMTKGLGSQGFSVELLGKVATGLGRTARIQELPWARCLRDVEAGRIDVAVDAYDDVARRTKFVYSMPYHTLTPQVFYVPVAPDSGPPATTAEALQKLKGCGVHEYTYEHYGLSTARMDLNAKTNRQMLRMLLAGRCDFAVEELEYIIGGRQTLADWPDETALRSYRPEWAQPPQTALSGRQGARRRTHPGSPDRRRNCGAGKPR
ncbi:MAG: hypothetical protein CFE44_01820 [Burkholderiales bacterium PBB4]|nr:MAG: hypothetical protein CFE44_01820 [Burkholderiales bacterium PBB4]